MGEWDVVETKPVSASPGGSDWDVVNHSPVKPPRRSWGEENILDPLKSAGEYVKGSFENLAKNLEAQDKLMASGTPEQRTAAGLERAMMFSPGAIETGAAKVASPIGWLIKKGVSAVLGKTTGAGEEAVSTAFNGSQLFKDAMRGKISVDDALATAKDALGKIRSERGSKYVDQLNQIAQKSGTTIDKTPVMNRLNDLMKGYRIGRNAKGELDFSSSTLDRTARGPIEDLISDVTKWQDWTPSGADALKKRIDDFYAPTSNSRALVTSLKNTLKGQIVKQVPEYNTMLKDYETATTAVNEIDKALSTGNKANKDTALRKLSTVFRDVNTYRKGQLDRLDQMAGTNIADMLAGASLSSALPRGFFQSAVPGAMGAEALFTHNPSALAAAPLFSPRAVGETANLIGKLGNTQAALPTLRQILLLQGAKLQNQDREL